VLECVEVCCNVLQGVAVCCSVVHADIYQIYIHPIVYIYIHKHCMLVNKTLFLQEIGLFGQKLGPF